MLETSLKLAPGFLSHSNPFLSIQIKPFFGTTRKGIIINSVFMGENFSLSVQYLDNFFVLTQTAENREHHCDKKNNPEE